MSIRFIFCLFILITLAACSAEGTRKLPGVYRIDIQQGSVIDQEMLDKLRPGMVKDQVHFIMGTPTIVDPFRIDRWEYIYTFSKGGNRRQQRHITIYFEEDKLTYLEGGVVRGIRKPPEEYRKERKTVDVPSKRRKQPGFFSKLKNVIPFVGDDVPQAKKTVKQEPSVSDAEETPPPEDIQKESKAAEVAAKSPKKKGFFSKLKNILPFIGDDEEKPEETINEDTDAGDLEEATPPDMEGDNTTAEASP